jgi:FHA domain/Domain of unknown function (DUF1707)
VLGPGTSRRQIARVLNTAYADGLLSEETFVYRLDQVFRARLIDPARVIGDLNLRPVPRRWQTRLREAAAGTAATLRLARAEPDDDRAVLLALDVVLGNPTVSRRHARLIFRDGSWVIRDLGSTNGTTVNGVTVGRCRLCPGDRLALGDAPVRID